MNNGDWRRVGAVVSEHPPSSPEPDAGALQTPLPEQTYPGAQS
jgi:hypothetical protein